MNEILANLMAVLDEEHARAVIEHRRVTIKKPLTAYGAKRLATRFAEWGDANGAADIMIDRCWQGFEVEWVKSRPQQRTGRATYGDLARDRMNGPENVFGGFGYDERVRTSKSRPEPDDGNLRIGFAGPVITSHH